MSDLDVKSGVGGTKSLPSPHEQLMATAAAFVNTNKVIKDSGSIPPIVKVSVAGKSFDPEQALNYITQNRLGLDPLNPVSVRIDGIPFLIYRARQGTPNRLRAKGGSLGEELDSYFQQVVSLSDLPLQIEDAERVIASNKV